MMKKRLMPILYIAAVTTVLFIDKIPTEWH